MDKKLTIRAARLLTLALIPLLASMHSARAQTEEPELVTRLRGYDEALLNAVHRGDRATWERMTTSDFSYIESGQIAHRRDILEALKEDGKKPLAIKTYGVHRVGDTAIVIFEAEVQKQAAYASSRSAGRFVMTETWQKIDGAWKLRLVHTEPVRTNPPAVTLAQSQLDELAGTYRSNADRVVIRREGQHLVLVRSDNELIELQPETRDVFFTPGDMRMRRVFQRDPASDRVTGFIGRMESSDTLFVRD
ncbi:nuclear transport factor 2 family protein [Roseateles chitinivorans]|uniref:nuclear transport factor 2 family protein n=1 Tax=Roseateles chitinivorans TaxID=2917965 RepID=UPI003D672BEC